VYASPRSSPSAPQHSLPGGATPYLHRSSTGWTAPASPGAHVTDLDLAVGDDDTGDQPFDQLPLLLPSGLVETLAHPVAELIHAQSELCDLGLAVHLRLELALLSSEGLFTLLQVTPPTLVFLQAHHARQVSLGQPLDLPLEAGLPAAEGLAARLQLLRQPVPAMRSLQREADRLRVGQHLAEVIPDQRVQLCCRDVARRTDRVPVRVQGRKRNCSPLFGGLTIGGVKVRLDRVTVGLVHRIL